MTLHDPRVWLLIVIAAAASLYLLRPLIQAAAAIVVIGFVSILGAVAVAATFLIVAIAFLCGEARHIWARRAPKSRR